MYNKDLSTMEALEGPVQFAHQFVDMPEYNVQVKTNTNTKNLQLNLMLWNFILQLLKTVCNDVKVPDSVSGELTTVRHKN